MIKFFRRKRKPKKTIEEVLECITEDTLSEEDRKDEHKVQHYVLGHCEQMIDTTKTLENEKSEYRVVTSYLKDIQIIEELPEDEDKKSRFDACTQTVFLHWTSPVPII